MIGGRYALAVANERRAGSILPNELLTEILLGQPGGSARRGPHRPAQVGAHQIFDNFGAAATGTDAVKVWAGISGFNPLAFDVQDGRGERAAPKKRIHSKKRPRLMRA